MSLRAVFTPAGSTVSQLLQSPGDLRGRTGTVTLSGTPSPAVEAAPWALVLGNLALRGGEIRRIP